MSNMFHLERRKRERLGAAALSVVYWGALLILLLFQLRLPLSARFRRMVEPRVRSIQVHAGLHGDHGGAGKRQVGKVLYNERCSVCLLRGHAPAPCLATQNLRNSCSGLGCIPVKDRSCPRRLRCVVRACSYPTHPLVPTFPTPTPPPPHPHPHPSCCLPSFSRPRFRELFLTGFKAVQRHMREIEALIWPMFPSSDHRMATQVHTHAPPNGGCPHLEDFFLPYRSWLAGRLLAIVPILSLSLVEDGRLILSLCEPVSHIFPAPSFLFERSPCHFYIFTSFGCFFVVSCLDCVA